MATFLSSGQRDLLNLVLDRLIPEVGSMPAAGKIGVDNYLDAIAGSSSRLGRQFSEGLRSIEKAATSLGSDFAEMNDAQRDKVLREIEVSEPAFFETLMMQTYNGYYSDAKVIEALGLEPRAPQPRGHEVEFGDFSTLEAVSARGQAYREA